LDDGDHGFCYLKIIKYFTLANLWYFSEIVPWIFS
jgi:hypothetical protein